MVRRAALVPIVLVVPAIALGCATLFGDGPSKSRQDAIAACIEAVPAETVAYSDAFAACMEGYGWVHQSVSASPD